MWRSRGSAAAAVLCGTSLLIAGCGSGGARHVPGRTTSGTVAQSTYPPAAGRGVSPALARSIREVLRPVGLPSWATPPLDAAAARIAVDGPSGGAFVAPLRAGAGWCLGYLRAGRPAFGWCTARTGSSSPIEGGAVFLSMSQVGILARVGVQTARLVVRRADGRHIPVALHHGVALAPIGETTRAGDRPVSVEALDSQGHLLARRSLGWSAGRWRRARPRPPSGPTRAQLRALLKHPPAPCLGRKTSALGIVSSEVTFVETTEHPLALVADILPASFGANGGELFLQAARGVRATLVDHDGTRRAIPLGAGHCAYVALSPRDRRAPFRLEARTPAGKLQVIHPGDWSGFPTDDS